jgi:hypothetical protein
MKPANYRQSERTPVQGDRFVASKWGAYFLLQSGALAEMIGLGLIIAWAFEAVPFWSFLVGVGALLAGGGTILSGLLQLGVQRQLIFGADRLQKVESRGKTQTVVLEVPYRNLAEVAYFRGEEEYIGIDLIHSGDLDTFAQPNRLDETKVRRNHHVVLDSSYDKSLRIIYDTLKSRIRAAREIVPGEGKSDEG